MLRQHRLLIVTFFLLCLVSIGISYRNHFLKSGLDQEMFRLPLDVKVNCISIHFGADSVILKGGPSGWTVNDQYSADLSRIRLLFAAVDRARPRRIISGPSSDSLKQQAAANGIRVSFQEQQRTILEFLVWGSQQLGQTWFMNNEMKTPVEMNIPGYRSNLFAIFSTKESEWRDKRVFDFNWRNFSELSANFPGRKEQNLNIQVTEGLLSMAQMENPDTTRLKNYMEAIQLLESDEILQWTKDRQDSIILTTPQVILTLKEISGRTHELRLFQNGTALLDSAEVHQFGMPKQQVLLANKKSFLARPVANPNR